MLQCIERCEVCGNKSLKEVINLGLHPLCDDLVEIGSDRICKEYDITIVFCENCNTAHQKYQVPKNELFPRSYHYRSRFTGDVLNGMEILVSDIILKFGEISQKKVLDIGCNDGSLLTFFKNKGALTFGLEPTDAFLDAQLLGHQVFNEYLTLAKAKEIVTIIGKVDIITFTNVFAHIEDLNSVISSLKEFMHTKTIIVIENHYLGAVIEKNQFDTFYHEHPRTYSYTSFKFIAEKLGINILNVEFPSRYGGNIRVILGKNEIYKSFQFDDLILVEKEMLFYSQLQEMNEQILSWKQNMKDKIEYYVLKYGKIKGKAFPGRAAILIKLLGIDVSELSAVYEKPGSLKIGHYIPGTRIPIKSDIEMFDNIAEEKIILNLAWHIKSEIKKYLDENNFTGEILNIL